MKKTASKEAAGCRIDSAQDAEKEILAEIQWVKYTARGFRNKRNFQTAIYFQCGGLDIAPSCH
jgi:hypothetical protein